MRLPDFIVIGAAKSGTTALCADLAKKRDVFVSTPKEPEFFARDDRHADGLDSYARLFEGARHDQICGEGSTIYTLSPHFPHAAARMAAAAPDAKLVYMMREPVARAYSFYGQLVKNYQNKTKDLAVHRTFEQCLDPDAPRAPRERFFAPFDAHYPDVPGIFLDGGDYPQQIRAYLVHFPRERILFVTFEEFIADPAAVMARIHAHIGAAPEAQDAAPPAAVNVAAEHFDRARLDRFASGLTGKAPILRRISRALPPGLRAALRRQIFRLLGGGRQAPDPSRPPRMRPETRALLHTRYAPQRAELAALTGLDLDLWWGTAEG
jgi:hypothetical protein